MMPEIGLHFTAADAIDALSKRLSLPAPEKRAFDVVNCLRIAAAYFYATEDHSLDLDLRISLESTARLLGTDHPYEQWLKWLGIIHLQCKKFTEAENCFAAAKSICNNHEFTMKTIGASIELLRVLTKRIKNPGKINSTNEKYFYEELKKLREQSVSFDAYISKSKILDALPNRQQDQRAGSKTLWHLYTFLPFSYS